MPRTKSNKITKQQIVEKNIIDILNDNKGVMPFNDLKIKSAIPPVNRAITRARFSQALINLSSQIYTHRDVGNAKARHKIVKIRNIQIEAIL